VAGRRPTWGAWGGEPKAQVSSRAPAAAAAGFQRGAEGAAGVQQRRHASRQHEAVAHLRLVQEALVGLVDGAGLDLAGAGGAGTGCGAGAGRGGARSAIGAML
jgi:hypothetical protein